ncbi:MAG: YgjV family protein [Clostridiales bacterium]|nr:YgjV family protein [Clostridiales bacterium]
MNIYLECMGYLASVLCVVSLVMLDMKKLRWFNLIASAMFVVYSLLNKSYPVALTNVMIVIADIYYLFKIYRSEEK